MSMTRLRGTKGKSVDVWSGGDNDCVVDDIRVFGAAGTQCCVGAECAT